MTTVSTVIINYHLNSYTLAIRTLLFIHWNKEKKRKQNVIV